MSRVFWLWPAIGAAAALALTLTITELGRSQPIQGGGGPGSGGNPGANPINTPLTDLLGGRRNLPFPPDTPPAWRVYPEYSQITVNPPTAITGQVGDPFRILNVGTGTITSVDFQGDNIVDTPVLSGPFLLGTAHLVASPKTQTANTVLAGPLSGPPAFPSFRPLSFSDLPSLPCSSALAGLVPPTGGGTTNWLRADCTFAPIPAGPGGTVTSVAFVGDGVVDSATPSTAVTSAGNVTATILTQAAHTALLGPASGGPAAPSFRLLQASDLPPLVTSVTDDGRNTLTVSPNVGSVLEGINLSNPNQWLAGQATAPFALTDASPIVVVATNSDNYTVTLNHATGTRQLQNPSAMFAGQTMNFWVLQDGTGGAALTFGTNYHWTGGTAPTITTAANAQDLITCVSKTTTYLGCAVVPNVQ